MVSTTFPIRTLLTPKLSLPPHGSFHRNAAAEAAPWPRSPRIRATREGDVAAAAAAPRPRSARIRATREGDVAAAATTDEEAKARRKEERKRCLRCGALYLDEENSAAACAFHGHITGEKGLFSLSPPHQGIDGEWSDKSGVIVYRWNDRGDRPNTGRANWKGRWSCCQERDEEAPPCRRGFHVSYDDGFTLF